MQTDTSTLLEGRLLPVRLKKVTCKTQLSEKNSPFIQIYEQKKREVHRLPLVRSSRLNPNIREPFWWSYLFMFLESWKELWTKGQVLLCPWNDSSRVLHYQIFIGGGKRTNMTCAGEVGLSKRLRHVTQTHGFFLWLAPSVSPWNKKEKMLRE